MIYLQNNKLKGVMILSIQIITNKREFKAQLSELDLYLKENGKVSLLSFCKSRLKDDERLVKIKYI